jgi:biotin transport system substrate-specific component
MNDVVEGGFLAQIRRHAGPMATIIAGIGLMTLSAKVQIPFWPVPLTLHTVAVMAFAATFGAGTAGAICLGYLLAGAVGLPVFSGTPERGIGLAYMMGPTGGYLAGFLVASILVGALAAGRGIGFRIIAMLAGLAVIYLLGVAWLSAFVPADKLWSAGVWPFLIGDLIKVVLAACLSSMVPEALRKLGRWNW